MEQQHFAAKLVRTQALTGGSRSDERGRFLSNSEILDLVNIPSRCFCKVRARQNLCDFAKCRFCL